MKRASEKEDVIIKVRYEILDVIATDVSLKNADTNEKYRLFFHSMNPILEKTEASYSLKIIKALKKKLKRLKDVNIKTVYLQVFYKNADKQTYKEINISTKKPACQNRLAIEHKLR